MKLRGTITVPIRVIRLHPISAGQVALKSLRRSGISVETETKQIPSPVGAEYVLLTELEIYFRQQLQRFRALASLR